MRQEFSTSWISSKQPRKQHKYVHNAPLHIRRSFMSAHLSDALAEKYGKRSLPLRKGDEVSVMRGENKKKTGKVASVNLRKARVFIENLTSSKRDGTKVMIPFHPSNLQIISVAEDGKRFAKAESKQEKQPKKSAVKEK